MPVAQLICMSVRVDLESPLRETVETSIRDALRQCADREAWSIAVVRDVRRRAVLAVVRGPQVPQREPWIATLPLPYALDKHCFYERTFHDFELAPESIRNAFLELFDCQARPAPSEPDR
jgi:hypothetical protein